MPTLITSGLSASGGVDGPAFGAQARAGIKNNTTNPTNNILAAIFTFYLLFDLNYIL
jgi:hypothetical protein